MGKLKRFISILISAALVLSFTGVSNISMVKAVTASIPAVSAIGTSYMVGDRVNITLTSTGTKLVQYSVILTNIDTNKVYNITKGYTPKYYNPKYKYPLSFSFAEAGKYVLAVSSKPGGYSTSYSRTISKQITVLSNSMLIDRINPVLTKANIGDSYTLPPRIAAIMKDGSSKDVDVKWDNTEVKTDAVGEQYFYGTVPGYSGKVKLTLSVVDEKIISIDPIKATVEEGKEYRLPDLVTAKLNKGTKQAAVKWNKNIVDTNKPGTYKFEGSVEGYSGTVDLTLTVKEVPLNIDSVSAANLKEINMIFNKKVDQTTIKPENIRVYRNTTPISSCPGMNQDEKSLTLSISPYDFSLDNKTEYTIIIEGVKDLNGKPIEKLVKNITVNDSTVPFVNNVSVTGPDSIQIEFSEPIKNIGQKLVEIKSGTSVINAVPVYSGFNTNRINVVLNTRMTENAVYEVTVKGFTDFAGFTNAIKTQQLAYKSDTAPITAEIKRIDPSYAVIAFNKQVKGLVKEDFYNTIAGRTPLGIYSSPEMITQIGPNDYVDQVWIKFYDRALNTGYPITDGEQKLFILNKAGTNEIRDRWGNPLQTMSLSMKASLDKSKPGVEDLRVETESSLIVEFDKNVNFTLSNLEILDQMGSRILGLSITYCDNNKYRINLGKSYLGNKLKMNLNNVEDKSIVPNRMEPYSSTIEVTDKTPPTVKKAVKKFISGLDQSIYIYFTEPVNNTAIDISNYYLQNPSSGMMVKLTEKPSALDENKTIRLPLTGEQKELVNQGYNLFVSGIQDVYKNPLPGQIVQNSKLVTFDSSENKPKIVKLEAVDKKTLVVTFDQSLKRVDMNAILLNGASPAAMELGINDDGNTIVTLTAMSDREFLSDLRGLTLLNVLTDADKRIENSFGLGVENGFYTTGTPIRIQDKIAPAIRAASGIYQIRTFANASGIIDTLVIEYEENIDSTKLSALSYNVEGRAIARVYTNPTGVKGIQAQGNFVIIELKTDGITQNANTRIAITQVLDIYDMFDNKLSPNGQAIVLQDNSGPAVVNRISSQIYRGETRVVTFSKPLNEISKIVVQNMIIAAARGKGALIFTWSENKVLSVTNYSSTDSTDFLLSTPTRITLTGTDGSISTDAVLIGW